jgi:hypothetical protein
MAETVWLYTKQDPSTSHAVYAASTATSFSRGAGLVSVSICGLADVGAPGRWKGTAVGEARHLKTTRQCPRCLALIAAPPVLAGAR